MPGHNSPVASCSCLPCRFHKLSSGITQYSFGSFKASTPFYLPEKRSHEASINYARKRSRKRIKPIFFLLASSCQKPYPLSGIRIAGIIFDAHTRGMCIHKGL